MWQRSPVTVPATSASPNRRTADRQPLTPNPTLAYRYRLESDPLRHLPLQPSTLKGTIMCGRYALAADADEIPLQFWRQYHPDHQDPVKSEEDRPSASDAQHSHSRRESSEHAGMTSEGGDGFGTALGLPQGSVGGLTPVDGAGLGRSGAGAGAGAGKGAGPAPIEWASDQAKWGYRKRYNVRQHESSSGSSESDRLLGYLAQVAPRTRCPVVRRDASGKLVVDSLRWGIISNWSKEEPGLQPIK